MNPEYQEFELDLYQIINKIFTSPIKPPFSYQILFDDAEINENSTQSQYFFEQLLMIFVEALKIYFKKDNIDIAQISQEDFYKISQYFNSFGFNIYCNIEKILDENKVDDFLENDELPSLNTTQPTETKSTSNTEKSTEFVRQSESGISRIETTGDELKDYKFIFTKENVRYVISFDFYKYLFRNNF